MSPSGDRVTVPTNGHRPALSDPDADADLAESTDLGVDSSQGRPAWSTVPAVSPAQLAAGFGIIAALILLVLGRRRGRRD